MTTCPYCKNTDYIVGMSVPIVSLSDDWDIEQLVYCTHCKHEFVVIYSESGSISIESSTVFTPSDNPGIQ